MNYKQEEKITALYERLSRDDEQLGDSNSIKTQKTMLEEYAEQHGYKNIVHYTDDGYSGGSFDRPDWKRMMNDIEEGKVSTVIAKDMSRIGRNYLEVGYYTEVVFRQRDIHFIAITNGVDSDNQGSSEFAPFLNVMNEWYLRDCSRKIKASKQVLGNSGVHLASLAPYGYKKDPNDKHRWLIDEEAAPTVRRIYQLCIEGNGTQEISRILQRDKIWSPAYYQAKHGIGRYRNNIEAINPYDWSSNGVKTILTRPENMGHTVNFRTASKSYKEKKNIINTPDKWAVFENTQEAIVDSETWHLAQKLIETPRRNDTMGYANPLTGIVFCADCGAKMYNHRSRPYVRKDGKKQSGFDVYECSTYKLSIRRADSICSSHHISTKAINELVLYTIREVSRFAIKDREAFLKKVHEASNVQQEQEAKELKRKLNKNKRRYDEVNVLYKKLYESFAVGKIPEDKFDTLSGEYLAEQKKLEETIAEEEKQLDEFSQNKLNAEGFLALAEKYTDFTELTPQMLNEFIDKILVHKPQRIGRDRVQDVEIYLNFIGRFEAPIEEHEPTAEELEQQRIKKYWKDKYWEHKDYELARRKKQKQERDAEQARNFKAEHEKRVAEALSEVRLEEEQRNATGDITASVVSVAELPHNLGVRRQA